MRVSDLALVATEGLRGRRARVALSAGGVAIGIAAMVAVLGISQSSRADLLAQLDRLGTNLLTVQPGRGDGSETPILPDTAPAMIARVGPVREVTAVAQLDATVRRSDKIPVADTGGLTVAAAHPDLVAALGATMTRGRFLDAALERYPTVVLGADAASQLGIDRVDGTAQVFLANQWFTVVGVLAPVPLVGDLDRTVLIGYPEAHALTDADPSPTSIYVRANPDDVIAVEGVLAATANPADPNSVSVGRPSDVLAARAAAKSTLTGLFLGLGAVALLVGGLGIANVMVVAVIERRGEIGLRRALGATRAAVGGQFMAEALVLSVIGGIAGSLGGIAVTALWARHQGWPATVPPLALIGAVGAAALVGAIAGLVPATRAARLTPTEALRA